MLKFKKEEERIEKRGEKKDVEIGRKEGRLEKAIEMAKGMKKEGFDLKIIAKLSGLTEEQIEKL